LNVSGFPLSLSTMTVSVNISLGEKLSTLTREGHEVKIYHERPDLHRLRWRIGKIVERKGFADRDRAFAEGRRILDCLASGRGDLADFDFDKIAYVRECLRKLDGEPLHEAVEFFMARNVRSTDTITILIPKFLQEKISGERHSDTLRGHLNAFEQTFGKERPCEVMKPEICLYLANVSISPKTQHNHWSSLSNFFNWCRRKGLVKFPPVTNDIELPSVKRSTPGIYTPDELPQLFKFSPRKNWAYLAISAWCGGRRAEIERLHFHHIKLDSRIIVCDREVTKTNQRRILEIPENVVPILELFRESTGKIVTVDDPLEALRDSACPVKLVHNGLRHSFCSYHLGFFKNAALTSLLAGNSEQELNASYKQLVEYNDACRWYGITLADLT
jgi:integrase